MNCPFTLLPRQNLGQEETAALAERLITLGTRLRLQPDTTRLDAHSAACLNIFRSCDLNLASEVQVKSDSADSMIWLSLQIPLRLK